VIQKYVQDPLAELILGGEVKDGETVPIAVERGALMVGRRTVTNDEDAKSRGSDTIVRFPRGA
jgi:ATP-dependent Clp protease ATP-binding subunit ClpB